MKLEITPTRSTPLVRMDTEKHEYLIQGRSLPEEGLKFYEGIVEWLEANMPEYNGRSELKVNLQYCNTSSYKGLLLVFQYLQQQNKKGHQFTIIWFYDSDDEDWLEDGRSYQELVDVPFVYVPND